MDGIDVRMCTWDVCVPDDLSPYGVCDMRRVLRTRRQVWLDGG